MSAITRRVTATQTFRGIQAPYRKKMEKSDAARGKLEGRMQRAFDDYEADMRNIWAAEEEEEVTTDLAAPVPAEAAPSV